jgi:MFS family permease
METPVQGTIAGTLFGGWLGDRAALWSPGHGRPWVAVVSVGGVVPMTVALLLWLPQGDTVEEANELRWLWMSYFFVYGFWIVWVVGVNGPIFSEIVPPKYRSYIYALDAAIELCFSSIGGPLSGYIAEQAGFREPVQVCDKENGEALATGMLWVMVIPWTACTLCYCVLHLTYPADRQLVLDRAAAAAHGDDDVPGAWIGEAEAAGSADAVAPERRDLPSPLSCCCRCGRNGKHKDYAPLESSDRHS